MNSNELQQRIDSGVYRVPNGTHSLDRPLFLNTAGAGVWGWMDGHTILDCSASGIGIIAGWRRGLVSDDHYTGAGFRTFGDTHLFSKGTTFDLGPTYWIADRGWEGETLLTIKAGFTLHDGQPWNVTAGGNFTSLCGIHSGEDGTWPAPHPARPSPWALWWETSGLHLGLKTSDGINRRFLIPANASNPVLDLEVTVDLTAGTVTALVNGETVTVGLSNAGVNWGLGLMLAGNDDLAPFCLGRLDPWCNSEGWWGSDTRDMTIRRFELTAGNTNANCRVELTAPRPSTYVGGPSLPLVTAWSQRGTRYLLAVHSSQGVPDSIGGVVIRDMEILGNTTDPVILMGGIQGGIRLERCLIQYGSRALANTDLAVTYPVFLVDCVLQHQRDRNLYLRRVSTMAMDRCELKYATRTAATLIQVGASLRDIFIAPPGPPAQDVVFDQKGGVVSYQNVGADYEYEPAPVLVSVQPYSVESPTWETLAGLDRCGAGAGTLWQLRAAQPGYVGETVVKVNGAKVNP